MENADAEVKKDISDISEIFKATLGSLFDQKWKGDKKSKEEVIEMLSDKEDGDSGFDGLATVALGAITIRLLAHSLGD